MKAVLEPNEWEPARVDCMEVLKALDSQHEPAGRYLQSFRVLR
jgi:hypothetical protein